MTQVRNLINKSIDMFEMLKKILIEIDWVSNTIDQRLINHKVNSGLLIWTRNMCLSKDSINSPPHEQIDILVVDKIDNLVECIKVRKRHLQRLALKEYSKSENQTARTECDFEENGLTIIAQYRNQRWN